MFGLNDNDVKGLKGAKRLHKELKDKFISEKTLDNQAIDCSLKGEAVALFEIVDVKGNVIIYKYTGTAN